MRRFWLIVAFFGVVLYAAMPVGAGLQSGPRTRVLQLVNGVRAAHGLAPYAYNAALAAAAQDQADYLAATGTYVHTGWGGSTPASRARAAGYVGFVSENVVGGTDLTPSAGVIWWQNSAIHLAGMVSTRYIHAGTGYAFGHGQHFYTLVMGRPTTGGVPPDPTGNVDNSAAPIFVTPIELAEPNETGTVIHIVQPGQTAWAIAARYEVPLSDVLLFNSLEPNHTLLPGTELVVRLGPGQTPPPTPTPPLTHIVQPGQTAWTIAATYGISLSDLIWYNGLGSDGVIHPGDELTIRLLPGQAPRPTATPQRTHIVVAGDSAWAIAAQYEISLSELVEWNGLGPEPIVRPGDELLIVPPSTATPRPTERASVAVVSTPTPTGTPRVVSSATPNQATAAGSTEEITGLIPLGTAQTSTPEPTVVTEPGVNASGTGGTTLAGAAFILLVLALIAIGAWRGWL